MPIVLLMYISPMVFCKVWVLKSKAELQDAIVESLERSPFDGAKGLLKPIGSWDVSAVTDMSGLFVDKFLNTTATKFNGDLSKWDVSRATNMQRMFFSLSSFNGDLSKWDVSKVTNMVAMFRSASSFRGGLFKWDVSKVTHM